MPDAGELERLAALKSAITSSPGRVFEIVIDVLGKPNQAGPRCLRYGSVVGGKGRSLQVWSSGMWRDANPAGTPIIDWRGKPRLSGDLLHLVAGKLGLPFHETANLLASKFGVPEVFVRKGSPDAKPFKVVIHRFEELGLYPADENSKAMTYLNNRGLSVPLLKLYRLHQGCVMREGKDHVCAAMPYLSRDGTRLLNVKYRGVDSKVFDSLPEAPPILFGLHLVVPTDKTLVLCEAEIDAMSVKEACPKLNVVAFGGAGRVRGVIEYMRNYINTFESFIIAFDKDLAGEKGTEVVIEMLGMRRCRQVVWTRGVKDCNEMLQKHGPAALADAIQLAEQVAPSTAVNLVKATETIIDRYYGPLYANAYQPEELQKQLRLLPWEATLWAGETGTGKSSVIRQIISKCALTRKERALFITTEDSAADYLADLCWTLKGERPGVEDIRQFATYCQETKAIMITDLTDRDGKKVVSVEGVIKQVEQFVDAYGVKYVVLDNVTFLVSAGNYEKGREAAQHLISLPQRLGISFHVVAHGATKALGMMRESRALKAHEIRGAQELPMGSQNIVSVYRNFTEEVESEDTTRSVLYYALVKARRAADDSERGSVRTIGRWTFFPKAKQFTGEQGAHPVNYLRRIYGTENELAD